MKQLVIIWSLVLLTGVGGGYIINGMVNSDVVHANGLDGTSDKYDGDCTPQATAGRCADKCPNPTDTLQGYDKDTGAAICRSAPTGCPYGDSIPVDSPKCVAPAVSQAVASADPAPVNDLPEFAGK